MAKIMDLLGKIGQGLHEMIQTTTALDAEIQKVNDEAQTLDAKQSEIETAKERLITLRALHMKLVEENSVLDDKKRLLEEQIKNILNKFK